MATAGRRRVAWPFEVEFDATLSLVRGPAAWSWFMRLRVWVIRLNWGRYAAHGVERPVTAAQPSSVRARKSRRGSEVLESRRLGPLVGIDAPLPFRGGV